MKKILFSLLLIFTMFLFADFSEDYNNVRYGYNSSANLLTISRIDTTKPSKIDAGKYFSYIRRIREEKGISLEKDPNITGFVDNAYAITGNYSISVLSGVQLPDGANLLFARTSGSIYIDPNIDTSNVNNMSLLFYEATDINADISRWNTSNVTDMNGMFKGAINYDPNVSNWDVSNVTDFSYMFAETNSANPDVSRWNLSKATNLKAMFRSAIAANPNVSNWDVSNVTNMSSMFKNTRIAKPDVSRWNVSKVEDMRSMFKETNFAPDVSNWQTDSLKYLSGMFWINNAVDQNIVSNFNFSNVVSNENGIGYIFHRSTDTMDYVIPEIPNDFTGAYANMFRTIKFSGRTGKKAHNNPTVRNLAIGSGNYRNYEVYDETADKIIYKFYHEGLTRQEIIKLNLIDDHMYVIRLQTPNISPVGQSISVELNHVLTNDDAKKGINNISELPKNTTFQFKTIVDTSTLGTKPAIVIVTFPDGTIKEVNVFVIVTELDASNYDSLLKRLNTVDVSVINYKKDGVYLAGSLLHDYYNKLYNVVSKNSIDGSEIFGGLILGYNFSLKNGNIGPFVEYNYDVINKVGIGLKYKINSSNKDLSAFIRYRLNFNDKILQHNADLYTRLAIEYVDKIYLQGQLSLLLSYASQTKLDDRVSINHRLMVRGDIGVRLGVSVSQSTKVYLEPVVELRYMTNQELTNGTVKVAVDNSKDYLNARLRLGLDHALNKINVGESISFDLNGKLNAKAYIGYTF